jgi:hypothetical protein
MGHCECHCGGRDTWMWYVSPLKLFDSEFLTRAVINVVLAFCMGSDLQAIYDSDQPLAYIFSNSFGKRATLGIWVLVVLVNYMMGSSMVRLYSLNVDRSNLQK